MRLNWSQSEKRYLFFYNFTSNTYCPKYSERMKWVNLRENRYYLLQRLDIWSRDLYFTFLLLPSPHQHQHPQPHTQRGKSNQRASRGIRHRLRGRHVRTRMSRITQPRTIPTRESESGKRRRVGE